MLYYHLKDREASHPKSSQTALGYNQWLIRLDRGKNMFDDEEDSSERLQQYLANQRTFLSWVRTSIALIGLGFAIERFSVFLQQFRLIVDPDTTGNTSSATAQEYSALVGIFMIVVGTSLIVYALKNYLDSNKTIKSGGYMPKNAIVYTASAAIIGLGIIMIIFLIGQML
jgi:putative membrane protein